MATATKKTADPVTDDVLEVEEVKETPTVDKPGAKPKDEPTLKYAQILKDPQFKAHKFILQFVLDRNKLYTVDEVQALLDKTYNKEVQ